MSNGGNISLGAPVLEGASVEFEVLAQKEKGPKLHVRRFKRKTGYQRHVGYRDTQTVLKAVTIKTAGASKAKAEGEAKPKAKSTATKAKKTEEKTEKKATTAKKSTKAKSTKKTEEKKGE